MHKLKDNYLIKEIPMDKFIYHLKDIYDVLEEKNTSKSNPDTSLQAITMGFHNMDQQQYIEAEKHRLQHKALEAKLGYLHENLAGSLPRWRTLPRGGEGTGVDVIKEDGSEIMEWKNRDNTMNSSSAKTVVEKLMKCHADGKKVHLVQVQCGKGKIPRHKAPECINVMSGKDAYTYLSGRDTFFDDLNSTLAFTFKTFKTYESLLKELS